MRAREEDGERMRKQRHLKANRKYKIKKRKKKNDNNNKKKRRENKLKKYVKLDPTTDTE